MKKKLLTLVLTLVLLMSFSSIASATYTSDSGLWTDYWMDSNYVNWPIQTSWYTQETYTLSSGYNVTSDHVNDGLLKNANNIPLNQTMDNSTSLQQYNSGSYYEVGRINFYQWSYPSGGVIIPAGDRYFEGVNDTINYALVQGLGKAYYYWANYIDTGYWGSSGYITHDHSVYF